LLLQQGHIKFWEESRIQHCRVGMVLHSVFNAKAETFASQLVSAAHTRAISFLLVPAQPLDFSLTLILQVHDRLASTGAAHVAAVFPPPAGICHLQAHCPKPRQASPGDTQQAKGNESLMHETKQDKVPDISAKLPTQSLSMAFSNWEITLVDL